MVLDSTIIIHLRNIKCSHVLGSVADRMGWKLFLPNRVKAEVTRKVPLDKWIVELINSGKMTEVSSNKVTYHNLRGKYSNLGEGELDCIAIAKDCADKTLQSYIIISDDTIARAHGRQMGIRFVGILPVLSLANKHGFLSREQALEYLCGLKENNFTPARKYLEDFIHSLR